MTMKLTYSLPMLLLVALTGFGLCSCEEEGGLQESQLIYFSITEPYARIGGVTCTVDNINMRVTNVDPIPADIDLTAVEDAVYEAIKAEFADVPCRITMNDAIWVSEELASRQ